MVDFDGLLAQKYANQRTQIESEARLRAAQASVIPDDSAARNAALASNARATMLDTQSSMPLKAAQTNRINTLLTPEVMQMQEQTKNIGENTATSALNRNILNTFGPAGFQRSFYERLLGKPVHDDLSTPTPPTPPTPPPGGTPVPPPVLPPGWHPLPGGGYGASILDDPNAMANADLAHRQAAAKAAGQPIPTFAKGTSKVSGPGDGTVDTIPTMLANGEAVLNKGGAEMLGRDKIKHLNMLGALHMGMVGKDGARKAAGGPKGKAGSKTPAKGKMAVQHHAMGTEYVTPSPLISSGGGTGAAPMAGGTVTPTMMGGQMTQQGDYLMDQLGMPNPTPPTQTPMRYATGHSNVGKGKQSDTPKPTAQNVRKALMKLQGLGMAKKPPKGLGSPGMV